MAAELAYDLNTALPLELPEREVEKPRERNPQRQVKRRPVSKEEIKKNNRMNNLMVAKIFVVMALAIFVIGVCAHSFEMKDLSILNLEETSSKLEMQQERKNVLTDKLNKLVTENNIDKVATKLGLVKVLRGSENYVDSNPENRVVFSKSIGSVN